MAQTLSRFLSTLSMSKVWAQTKSIFSHQRSVLIYSNNFLFLYFSDQDLCKQHLINYLIKLFLDSKEHLLQKLIDKFSNLSIGEEKMHLIELFLEDCCREITSDINWKCK